MRLIFIHDHKFVRKNSTFYSSGKYSKEIMERYLIDPIDKIYFIGRLQSKDVDISNLVQTSSEDIQVNPIPFLNKKTDFLFRRRKAEQFLKENIGEDDIVIIRLPSEIGYIAASYLENKNISYGIELVGDPWDSLWHHGSLIGKIMAFINREKVKKYLEKSNHNVYVTRYYLQNKYPSKRYYVASNVLINNVSNKFKSENKDVKKIGLIGSLDTKYKGIETALKSLSLIKANFIFEIVGNGPKEKWQRKIKKYNLESKVKLIGTLKSGKEIDNWLSTLDLYIQPSYTEGLPRALIEAMSNGIPALGSKAGGIPELLKEEYLHEIKNYKQFARQIDDVLHNLELRKRMSCENLTKATDYLSNNIQNERKKFIKSIIEEHNNES